MRLVLDGDTQHMSAALVALLRAAPTLERVCKPGFGWWVTCGDGLSVFVRRTKSGASAMIDASGFPPDVAFEPGEVPPCPRRGGRDPQELLAPASGLNVFPRDAGARNQAGRELGEGDPAATPSEGLTPETTEYAVVIGERRPARAVGEWADVWTRPTPPPDHDAIPSAEGGSAQSHPYADAQERSHDAQHEDGKEGA